LFEAYIYVSIARVFKIKAHMAQSSAGYEMVSKTNSKKVLKNNIFDRRNVADILVRTRVKMMFCDHNLPLKQITQFS